MKLWLSSLRRIINLIICSNLFQTEENLIDIHHRIKENWQMPTVVLLSEVPGEILEIESFYKHEMLAFHVYKNSCIHDKNMTLVSRGYFSHPTIHISWKSSMAWWVDVFVWRQYDVVFLLVRSFLTLFFAIFVFPKMRFCCLN